MNQAEISRTITCHRFSECTALEGLVDAPEAI